MTAKFKVWQRVRLTQPIVVNTGWDGKEKIVPAGSMGMVRRHRNSDRFLKPDEKSSAWSYGVELDAVRDDPFNRGLSVTSHHVKRPDGSIVNILEIVELVQTFEAVHA